MHIYIERETERDRDMDRQRHGQTENEYYIPKYLVIKYHLVCLLSTYYKGCAITRKQALESDCHLYFFDR